MIDVTQRAAQASRILEDDLVKEAFEIIEKEAIAHWMNCSDLEGREREWQLLWCLRRFKQFFETAVNDGVIHQHQLQQFKRGAGSAYPA